jgi:hypothetical protein
VTNREYATQMLINLRTDLKHLAATFPEDPAVWERALRTMDIADLRLCLRRTRVALVVLAANSCNSLSGCKPVLDVFGPVR